MSILLGIVGAAALGGIIFLFLSPKSSKPQKLAALAALIISGVTLAICGVIIVRGASTETPDPYAFPVLTAAQDPVEKSSPLGLIIFLVVLIAFFGFIVYIGFRDQKKTSSTKSTKGSKDQKEKTGVQKQQTPEDVFGDMEDFAPGPDKPARDENPDEFSL